MLKRIYYFNFFKSEMCTVSDTFLNVGEGECGVKLEFLLSLLIIFPECFTFIKLKKAFDIYYLIEPYKYSVSLPFCFKDNENVTLRG